jgi:hypothetical protein
MSEPGASCDRNRFKRVRLLRPIVTVLLAVVAILSSPLAAQTAKSTDLQFHKFQPKVAPEQAVSGMPSKGTPVDGISETAAQQMQALQQEKATRTPAQQKIDSNVLYTIRMLAGQSAAPGVPYLYTGVDLDASDNIVVDMVAIVTDALLQQIAGVGRTGAIQQSWFTQHSGDASSAADRTDCRFAGRDLHLAQARFPDQKRGSSWVHEPAAVLVWSPKL